MITPTLTTKHLKWLTDAEDRTLCVEYGRLTTGYTHHGRDRAVLTSEDAADRDLEELQALMDHRIEAAAQLLWLDT